MSSIKPTIGRKVWYWGGSLVPDMACYSPEQPMDATVIYVWGDTCVSLRVTDHAGIVHTRTSVTLRDHREGDRHGVEYVATWMPYQTVQAKAAETRWHPDAQERK